MCRPPAPGDAPSPGSSPRPCRGRSGSRPLGSRRRQRRRQGLGIVHQRACRRRSIAPASPFGRTRVEIGMDLPNQPAIGGLDLGEPRALAQAERPAGVIDGFEGRQAHLDGRKAVGRQRADAAEIAAARRIPRRAAASRRSNASLAPSGSSSARLATIRSSISAFSTTSAAMGRSAATMRLRQSSRLRSIDSFTSFPRSRRADRWPSPPAARRSRP